MSKIKLSLKLVCSCIAIVLALAAFFMILAPAATAQVYGKTVSYSGFQLAFGCKEGSEQLFGASTNICTYILLLAGIGCVVESLLGKGGKISPIVSVVAFLFAGVFFFCAIPLSEFKPIMYSSQSAHVSKSAYSIGVGSIIGGVFSILAAVAAAVPVLIKKS